jgi:hypothetical protein
MRLARATKKEVGSPALSLGNNILYKADHGSEVGKVRVLHEDN